MLSNCAGGPAIRKKYALSRYSFNIVSSEGSATKDRSAGRRSELSVPVYACQNSPASCLAERSFCGVNVNSCKADDKIATTPRC